MENCVAAVAALMAASRLDAWAVLVNARLSEPEIARIRGHCEPRAVVFTDAPSADASRHAERAGAARVEDAAFGSLRLAGHLAGAAEPVMASNAEQVAAMIYTSGTTGSPKGVMLTHRNILFIASVSGRLRDLRPTDLVYGVLPVSHVFGLASTFLGTVKAGGALELVPRFDPAHLAAALAEGISVFRACRQCMPSCSISRCPRPPLVAPKLRFMSSGAPLDISGSGASRRASALRWPMV